MRVLKCVTLSPLSKVLLLIKINPPSNLIKTSIRMANHSRISIRVGNHSKINIKMANRSKIINKVRTFLKNQTALNLISKLSNSINSSNNTNIP